MGVALEVARAVIASPDMQLPAPLMLLLNGGEETVLTAAHGFIESSSWADKVMQPDPCHAGVNRASTGTRISLSMLDIRNSAGRAGGQMEPSVCAWVPPLHTSLCMEGDLQ